MGGWRKLSLNYWNPMNNYTTPRQAAFKRWYKSRFVSPVVPNPMLKDAFFAGWAARTRRK
jgi:hypothetical protein